MRTYSRETTEALLEAIRAYENQRPGRGASFLAEVAATLQRIREAPLAFPRIRFVRRPIVRRAKVTRFPYSIVYYVPHGKTVVIAIAHGRRRPGYWAARLG